MNRITLKRGGGVLLICVAALSSFAHGEAPNWNDAAIQWQDYTHGRELAHASGKPALVVFYADWCPTCHAYRQIFEDAAVVEVSKAFVMIRVNADEAPQLNQRFAFDGFYLPRVFVLGRQGEVSHHLYPRDKPFRYFIGAGRPDRLVALMRGIGQEISEEDALSGR